MNYNIIFEILTKTYNMVHFSNAVKQRHRTDPTLQKKYIIKHI